MIFAFLTPPMMLLCCAGIPAILLSVLWIWALVDCLTNEPAEETEKVIWILVIVFTHALGAVLYLIIRRPKRIEKYGR